MTGFGVAENNNFRVEIRSVNHRFIDISIKTPPFMNQYDITLRNILKERFQRGKFDITVLMSNHSSAQLILNKKIAKDIYNALQILQKELSIPGQITIDTIMEYRDLISEKEPNYDIDSLYSVFHEAVSDLEAMRKREGELIAKDVRKRIEQLVILNDQVKQQVPQNIVRLQEKITERLRIMLKDEAIDTNRILQEAVIMADKSDISEEINRIENHIKQFIYILDSSTIIGRKLDFLLQEVNREVNTLAYKSNDSNISKIVIDMKTEVEKIREQVQNLR